MCGIGADLRDCATEKDGVAQPWAYESSYVGVRDRCGTRVENRTVEWYSPLDTASRRSLRGFAAGEVNIRSHKVARSSGCESEKGFGKVHMVCI